MTYACFNCVSMLINGWPILTVLILLGLSSARGQAVTHFHSPDNKFEVIVESKEVSDSNTEWVYHLVEHGGPDTILLTTATTHDDPQPAVFWDKSSARLIFEDRRDNLNPIKIIELKSKTTIYSTSGFVGIPTNNFFDANNNLVFLLRHDSHDMTKFSLLTLDIQSFKVDIIKSIGSSGDPISGIPWIENLDTSNRIMTIVSEDKEYKQFSIELNY